MSVYVIGIDPGRRGGIVALDECGDIAWWRAMPTIRVSVGRSTARHVVDVTRLHDTLADSDTTAVVIEQQGPRPRDTPLGAFSTGRSYGALLAVCEMLELMAVVVPPATWKADMGLTRADKGASVAAAEARWPEVAAFRGARGGLRDGVAEAALIAAWWTDRGCRL